MCFKRKKDKKKVKEEKQVVKEREETYKKEEPVEEKVEKPVKKTVSKTSTKSKNTSTIKEENKKTEKASIYRVIYDKENKVWQIKKDGAKRVIATKHTKEEALARVKELSQNKDIGYIVHKKDGKFQKK